MQQEREITFELHGFNNNSLYRVLCELWNQLQYNSMDLLASLKKKLQDEPELGYREDLKTHFARRKTVVDKIVIRLNEELDNRNKWLNEFYLASADEKNVNSSYV